MLAATDEYRRPIKSVYRFGIPACLTLSMPIIYAPASSLWPSGSRCRTRRRCISGFIKPISPSAMSGAAWAGSKWTGMSWSAIAGGRRRSRARCFCCTVFTITPGCTGMSSSGHWIRILLLSPATCRGMVCRVGRGRASVISLNIRTPCRRCSPKPLRLPCRNPGTCADKAPAARSSSTMYSIMARAARRKAI